MFLNYEDDDDKSGLIFDLSSKRKYKLGSGSISLHERMTKRAEEIGRAKGMSDLEIKAAVERAFNSTINMTREVERSGYKNAVGNFACSIQSKRDEFRAAFTPDNIEIYAMGVLAVIMEQMSQSFMSEMFTIASVDSPRFFVQTHTAHLSQDVEIGGDDVSDIDLANVGRVIELDQGDEVRGEAEWIDLKDYDVMPAAFSPSNQAEMAYEISSFDISWWSIGATSDISAEYLARSLYMGDPVGDAVRQYTALTESLAFTRALTAATSAAGVLKTWARTPPAGSVFETLEPSRWWSTLFSLIGSFGMELARWKGVTQPLGWVAASPTTHVELARNSPQDRQGTWTFVAPTTRTTSFSVQSVTDGQATPELALRGFLLDQLSDDTVIFGPNPVSNADMAAFVHATYLDFTELEEQVNPITRKRERGGLSANKDVFLRPNNVIVLTIADE